MTVQRGADIDVQGAGRGDWSALDMAVGARVRQARKARGLTQPALVEVAGVSSKTVLRCEKGEHVEMETIHALAKALNVPEIWLRTGDGTEPSLGEDAPPTGSVGARIRLARRAKGLSHSAFGQMTSVPRTTVVQHESDAAPPQDFVEAVARALKVDINWLITGNGVAPAAIEGLQPPVIESGDLPKDPLEPSRSPAQGTPNEDVRAALVDRIGRAIELAGGGRELGEKIGISPRGLGDIAAGLRDPTPERLARAAGVSAGWLLTGEGDAEISSIPIYASQPQGGAGSVLDDWITGWLKLSTEHARALGPPDQIGAMYLRGDSMAPTYMPGQLLFVQRDPTARDDVCLVNVGGTLKIKRVRYTADGRVQLIPDNKNYPPEEYSTDDARVLGRVVDLKEK